MRGVLVSIVLVGCAAPAPRREPVMVAPPSPSPVAPPAPAPEPKPVEPPKEPEPEVEPVQEAEPALKACTRVVLPEESAAREKTCRALTGHKGKMVSCSRSVLGQGAAVVVSIQTSCGSDSCDVKSWICSKATREALVPFGSRGGNVEASPDGAYAYMDVEKTVGENPLFDVTISISRKDLRTGTISAFANCMSPRLSLGGAWIVCRNRSFDVLRVPVNGGAPELVARSGLAENEAYYSPYSYGYAGRVAFRSPTEIVYEVVRNTAESTRKVAPWHE